MNTIKIGYDDNLGLPNDFAAIIGCDIVPYHELEEMIAAFRSQTIVAMFAPAGTLPYIPEYEIIAQAALAIDQKPLLQTVCVSAKPITAAELNKAIIGRINQYCTTSFWGPQIYLMNVLEKGTSLHFKNTNGFADLLHKTALQAVDAGTVWRLTMRQHSDDADKVHELFEKDDLPAPIIVGTPNLPEEIKEKLKQFKTSDKQFAFSRFQAAELQAINEFLVAVHKTREYFNVVMV